MNQAELIVDLDVYRSNLAQLRVLAPSAAQLAVVKANAYGHGMVDCARAARDAGVDWLGVATPAEALALRASGDTGPLLCWLAVPGAPWAELIDAGVEVTASSAAQLDEIVASGRRAKVQLKVDTGLNRNGAKGPEWTALLDRAVRAQAAGHIEVTGVWSHFAASDEPAHPANDLQEQRFREAVEQARAAGLDPAWVHLANSAATATRPSSHFDLVRVGIASYGISPDPAVTIPGITPVMTARTRLAQVKNIAAGESVSYGWRWTAPAATRIGLIPVGYGDGLHRTASNRAEVGFGGVRLPIRGTICMDQCVVELGDRPASAGDLVTMFGPGDDGEPTAQEWALAAGTIGYEIVTRLDGRWTRVLRGER